MQNNSADFVNIFRSAAPYIHTHRGKTFVVKLPGELLQGNNPSHIIYDLALLNSLGIRLVLVYGARPQIEEKTESAGIKTRYHNALRVTDPDTMEYVKEVVGALGLEINARLSMSLGNTPMADARVRVVSGNYITAKPMGIHEGVDYQYTGTIRKINTEAINKDLVNNDIVLVAPIGYSVTGEVFNLSADHVAAELSVALAADKLIYLTDEKGLIEQDGKLSHQLTKSEAEKMLGNIKNNPRLQTQLKRAIHACQHDVKRVHFINGQVDGALLMELFSRDGIGTLISLQPFDDIRTATIEDIPGIFELIEPLETDGILVKRSREKLELEIGNFTVLVRDNVIIGCVAVYPLDTGAAELACLVVHPDYQNNGRASSLLNHVENIARSEKIRSLFVLTTRAQHWFLNQGFVETDVDSLPVNRKALYNYQRNSRVLNKHLA